VPPKEAAARIKVNKLLEAAGWRFSEDKNPLVGKEQARKYARSQNCRFVTLSNGNLHYFWDLERGNPCLITAFPTPTSVIGYQQTVPDPKRLIEEPVEADYIVLSQRPGYAAEAAWKNVDDDPGNPWAHRNLGGALLHLGRQEEAVEHLRKAAELSPNDERAWVGLAQALELAGDDRGAD
jgi:predicted Zn-dependent protease